MGNVESDPGARRAAFYSAAFDATGDSYTALRAVREGTDIVDWEFVDANALVQEGLSPLVGDVVGARLSRVPVLSDDPLFGEYLLSALASGQPQVFDTEVVMPAGEAAWRRVIVVPIDSDTITVTTRDVTRERYFEKALDHERQAMDQLADPHRHGGASSTLDSESRFLGRSAGAIFLGAGIIALANSYLTHLAGVDLLALRLTAVISILASLVVPRLPWSDHTRTVAGALVAAGLAFLVVSDLFDHYSHTESAIAVYPVFFIIIIAWSGLTQIRMMPVVVAALATIALGGLFVMGGHTSIGVQCVVVTMPAAALLGEVLSWSTRRAAHLMRLEVERRLHDPLTGLANRGLFVDRLDQALARVRRSKKPLAVLFIDLDRFKQVNDSLGHGAGDELLLTMASRLKQAVRVNDLVARFGGDEFAVLCEDLSAETDAADIASRILKTFEAPFAFKAREAYVSASIGISFSIFGSETAETILRDSDAAMYRAKDRGRGRFEIFDELMRNLIASRLALESALRRAVKMNALCVDYQPIVACNRQTVVEFEALLRWERPGIGLVEPKEFIAVAEETGLIHGIGEFVLREACRQAAEWATLWPDRRLGVAVNISSRQLLEGDIVELVQDALASSGLHPTLLTLELTETTLITDAVDARAILISLRDLGVNIALDDFGTGYSSLTYLRTFPIDLIKIDGSFVCSIDKEREAYAIVAAMVDLARHLDLKVVAEGVETGSQMDRVVSLGCDLVQGYLFSRPRPASEIPYILDGFLDPRPL